jgi:hypothetical protein
MIPKPWPVVQRFLEGIPDGSIGCDVGCGNGKYLGVNPNIWILGLDRCVILEAQLFCIAFIDKSQFCAPYPQSLIELATLKL